MPTHAERRVIPYRPDQLFELVAGVESTRSSCLGASPPASATAGTPNCSPT